MDIYPIDDPNPVVALQKLDKAQTLVEGLVTAADSQNSSEPSFAPIEYTVKLYGEDFRGAWRYLIDRFVVVNAVAGIQGQSIRRINATINDKEVTVSFNNLTNEVTVEKLKD